MTKKSNYTSTYTQASQPQSKHYDRQYHKCKSAIAIFIALLLFSNIPAMAQCVSDPPHTGLGSCMDFIAATSATATRQIQKLGYQLRYAPNSYTNHRRRIIYIQSYDCNSSETSGLYARLALLAHELGHAEYGPEKHSNTREDYIQSLCDGEGYAILNNIRVRAETLACSMNSIDIGIIASNAEELSKIYNLDKNDIRSLGKSFCKNNFTSTTKQNYIDYYGEHYDQNSR